MALKSTNNNQVSETGTLVFTVPADSSALIKEIYVEPTTADSYALIKIGTTSVGYFRTGSGTLGNHLSFIPKNGRKEINILNFLSKKGIFSGYPVTYGKKFSVFNSTPAKIMITYDLYDKDDMHKDMPNGEESKEHILMAYGQPSGNISTSGEHIVSQSNVPKDFLNFPFADSVPSNKKVEVYGVCFSARGADDGTTLTNYIHTKNLIIKRGTTTLFDNDNGLYCQGKNVASNGAFEAENGLSAMGECTNLYQREPLIFDTPLLFVEEEELNTFIVTEVPPAPGTPGTFLAKELEIAYIIKETKV